MPGNVITAGTTRTQAGATLITEDITTVNVSTAVASGVGDGVMLPQLGAGTHRIFLTNATNNPIQVYPFGSADVINGIAGSTGIAQQPNTTRTYMASGPGSWAVDVGYNPANVATTGGTVGGSTVIAGAARTLKRMAAAAAGAERNNALINTPLIPVAAWVASTAYVQGDVVSNGGNQYICQAGGTSAVSGGPSGVGTGTNGGGPITDGTATWYYQRPVRTTVTAADAPTVTYAGIPAALTQRFAAVAQASAFFFSGGVPTALGNGVRFPSVYVTSTGSPNSGIANYGATFPSVTFFTDALKVVVSGLDPLYNNIQWFIEVDDVPVSDSSLHPAALVNPGAVILDWTGLQRKARKVRVYLAPNQNFNGVHVSPQDRVWAPQNPNRYRLMVQGDSLSAGGNGFPIQPGTDWPSQLARLLGCDDVWNVATGGTGYISNNSGNKVPYGDATRLLDVTNNAPDVFIVAGNHNDQPGNTSAQQQAAIVSYLQAVRAALPNCIILAFGPDPEAQSAVASMIAAEASVQAAVVSLNDPLTIFVPIIGDVAGSWMTGTGKVTAQVGTGANAGNSDIYTSSDGLHPTQDGINYLARRYYAGVRKALAI